jgi:hypothetical protein
MSRAHQAAIGTRSEHKRPVADQAIAAQRASTTPNIRSESEQTHLFVKDLVDQAQPLRETNRRQTMGARQQTIDRIRIRALRLASEPRPNIPANTARDEAHAPVRERRRVAGLRL